jgi:hypothetical protein
MKKKCAYLGVPEMCAYMIGLLTELQSHDFMHTSAIAVQEIWCERLIELMREFVIQINAWMRQDQLELRQF